MRKSFCSNANSVVVRLQEREIRCKLPQSFIRKTQDSIGRTDTLQAFATFDFLPMPDMYLPFFNCQRFAWVSWLFWYRLGWIMLNSCWLQHTSIWPIGALAVNTGIAAVWWVVGNIFAARKGCGASHLMVRRKVLLNTSWSTLLESLGEKGLENSSKLGFS